MQNPSDQSPSKSQRKRDAHALKDLGEQLVNLDPASCEKLGLPDNIHNAVIETRRIKQHGARKRQLQYLGKLLRQIDADPIYRQLDRMQRPHRQAVALHHAAEQWRDRLINEGQSALTAFIDQYPQADRQHLRQLQRNAQQESNSEVKKATRQLFRYIRPLLDTEVES